MQTIDIGPRQLARPHAPHGGLITCSPCVRELNPIDLRAFLFSEELPLTDFRRALIHHCPKYVEHQCLRARN